MVWECFRGKFDSVRVRVKEGVTMLLNEELWVV